MNKIKFFEKTDFANLAVIANKKEDLYSKKRGYTSESKFYLENLINPIHEKLKSIKAYLSVDPYFSRRFDINLSKLYKETNQHAVGMLRDHIWISLADKEKTLNLKKSGIRYRHLKLPQIQVSIHSNSFKTASLWFERNQEILKYRIKFANFLKDNYFRFINNNYVIHVYNRFPKPDGETIIEKAGKSDFEKILNYLKDNKYNIGISKVISSRQCDKEGYKILGTIINEMKILIEEIYIPAFGLKQYIDSSEDEVFMEGNEKYELHKRKERNIQLIKIAKEARLQIDPLLKCDVCDFSFVERYGEIGLRYIEAHHLYPMSKLTKQTPMKIEDLAMVCSNCHRMLHRQTPLLKITDLKEMILL